MAKTKSIKFKVDKIICEDCNYTLIVKPFKIKANKIMELNGRRVPSDHIEHKCKEAK
mgnify:CR=1 FL=1